MGFIFHENNYQLCILFLTAVSKEHSLTGDYNNCKEFSVCSMCLRVFILLLHFFKELKIKNGKGNIVQFLCMQEVQFLASLVLKGVG